MAKRKFHVPIELPGPPVDPLDAATKQYVDDNAGGITFVDGQTVPEQTMGMAADDGVSTDPARADHTHGTMSFATAFGDVNPENIAFNTAPFNGTATEAARSDHMHGNPPLVIPMATTVFDEKASGFGSDPFVGTASESARADHRHGNPILVMPYWNDPGAIIPEITYGLTASPGTSAEPAHWNHSHGTPPQEVLIGPDEPAVDVGLDLWVDTDAVAAPGAVPEEVFVGPDEPAVGHTFDLWVDSDAVAAPPAGGASDGPLGVIAGNYGLIAGGLVNGPTPAFALKSYRAVPLFAGRRYCARVMLQRSYTDASAAAKTEFQFSVKRNNTDAAPAFADPTVPGGSFSIGIDVPENFVSGTFLVPFSGGVDSVSAVSLWANRPMGTGTLTINGYFDIVDEGVGP